jgi:hypothetical protein
LVQQQVDAGRMALNFSEWDRPQVAGAARAAASVQDGSMPPRWMDAFNPDQRLLEADRAALVRGLLSTLNGLDSSP